MFFLYCVSYALCMSVYMCLVVTGWESLASWLSFVVYNCEFVTFLIGILGQVWYLIVSIPDLCTLTFFESSTELMLTVSLVVAFLVTPQLHPSRKSSVCKITELHDRLAKSFYCSKHVCG